MSADVIKFVKNKFVNEFAEAVEECGEFPLRSHFEEILLVILGMTISPTSPLEMKDWLYDLGFALAECRILSEERKRRAQNKETTFPWQLAKEFLFLGKTRIQLRRTKAKLRDIHAESIAQAGSSSSSFLPLVRATTSFKYFDEAKIYGFKDQIWEIEERILQNGNDDCDIKAIGIVGMGGSGKSTLAKMILHRPAIEEHFDCMIWVWLSEKLDPENTDSRKIIVEQMLENLSYRHTSSGDHLGQLLHELHDRLSDERYLIVLDNVCQASDWYSDLVCKPQMGEASGESHLSHGFPTGCGGAIIVTSRDEEVASQMVGERNLHRVEPVLDAESCWSIFMDSIRKKEFVSPENLTLLRMKDEIVDQCDGLPLAAKTLAEIISAQIAQKPYWFDSKAYKKIDLELDIYDEKDMRRAEQLAGTLPGVRIANAYRQRRLLVYGHCNFVDVARELAKCWQTELISMLKW